MFRDDDLRPPALALHPAMPAITLAPALGVPAPRAANGRVILLGLDLDPFDAAELAEALAAAAEEAAAGERLIVAYAGKEQPC